MALRVGILAEVLRGGETRGLPKYLVGLVGALERSGTVDVRLIVPCAPLAETETPAGAWKGRVHVLAARREVFREQIELPYLARKERLEVLHAPSNRGLPAFAPCPMVLTRHDAIERLFPPHTPASFRSRFRMYYSDEISIRRASAIVTVSETSRRDVLCIWSIPPEKVITAGEGIADRFFEPVPAAHAVRVREKYGLRSPFILYLGGLEPRKDVTTLVEAYARWSRQDIELALCGPTRWGLADVQAAIARFGVGDHVHITGPVEDADVPALYAGAACFVYPSRYEGFGLQAAEAMAMGTPLIVSDGGALPEVVGDAALVFPVGNPEALRSCLERIFADRSLRDDLAARGRARAEQFRWDRVVPNYLALYRRVIAERNGIGTA